MSRSYRLWHLIVVSKSLSCAMSTGGRHESRAGLNGGYGVIAPGECQRFPRWEKKF